MEAKIIKYLKFAVKAASPNNYGDLVVHSQNNEEYKISKKREALFGIFQPGNEVIVGYGTYMNKDYIAVAHLAQDFPKGNTVEEEKPKTVSSAPQSKSEPSVAVSSTPIPKQESKPSFSDGKNRSYALSYAKDYVIAGKQSGEKLTIIDVLLYAKIFESYLDSGIIEENKWDLKSQWRKVVD